MNNSGINRGLYDQGQTRNNPIKPDIDPLYIISSIYSMARAVKFTQSELEQAHEELTKLDPAIIQNGIDLIRQDPSKLHDFQMKINKELEPYKPNGNKPRWNSSTRGGGVVRKALGWIAAAVLVPLGLATSTALVGIAVAKVIIGGITYFLPFVGDWWWGLNILWIGSAGSAAAAAGMHSLLSPFNPIGGEGPMGVLIPLIFAVAVCLDVAGVSGREGGRNKKGSLESLTVKELIIRAKAKKIAYSGLKKIDLIARIRQNRSTNT